MYICVLYAEDHYYLCLDSESRTKLASWKTKENALAFAENTFCIPELIEIMPSIVEVGTISNVVERFFGREPDEFHGTELFTKGITIYGLLVNQKLAKDEWANGTKPRSS